MEDPKDLTPEQKKEIRNILVKSHIHLLFVGFQAMLIFFIANLFCFFIMAKFLIDPDADPSGPGGFQFFTMLVNISFLIFFLTGRMKENDAKVKTAIKEVLKK